jgi:hypothetical protein
MSKEFGAQLTHLQGRFVEGLLDLSGILLNLFPEFARIDEPFGRSAFDLRQAITASS